ncbi:Ecdysteroid-regulated 16 kDa protein [Trachymyrmex zeteki]|uniref:Ecdysteroid-regulated 16 kDa protein n=1 Tax=Mycetomoellerius zeteki TaxID=64791 RepID=A0A151WJV0_9HYME|nr:Ecdysteroid-regulated 16 kDa protein [Trachymyrmex zeteki]
MILDIPIKDADQISISDCEKPVCLLKQGTIATVEIKLVPNTDIQKLTNNVTGIVTEIPLPFVGVDGTNACDNIYNADGNKVGCPLKKDQQYVYRNSFRILPIYPRIQLTIRYALQEGSDRVVCFKVPAKITK